MKNTITLFNIAMIMTLIFWGGFIYVMLDRKKEKPVSIMPDRHWVVTGKRYGQHLSKDVYYTMKDKNGNVFETSFPSEYNVGDTIK